MQYVVHNLLTYTWSAIFGMRKVARLLLFWQFTGKNGKHYI